MIGFSGSTLGDPGRIRVQVRDGQDFTIPPPQGTDQRAAPAAPVVAANPFAGLERAATTPEIIVGAASLALLAVIFLFVRHGVRVHLINRRATLDAADGASWMLFSALMLTATVLVGATVGRLWQAWAGLTAAFTLCVILFAAALALFLRAPDQRR
jgi:hypothetical protein